MIIQKLINLLFLQVISVKTNIVDSTVYYICSRNFARNLQYIYIEQVR